MEQLTDGLWRWTARHPEWHPGEFGKEVACFLVEADGATVLVDPLLPEPEDAASEVLDGIDAAVERAGGGRVAITITIPYHVRSSEELWRRYRTSADTTIHGHRACAKRLGDRAGFRELEPGAVGGAGQELPGGVTAHAIGKPRRYETPLHLRSHGALVFGDAVAEHGDRLRVWSERRVDEKVERFYRERFNPTLQPLLELDFDRVLVTHGEPVMADGKKALRSALRAKPWYHRP
jgi:hypothetical protein